MAAMQKFETKFMINEGEHCVVLANKALLQPLSLGFDNADASSARAYQTRWTPKGCTGFMESMGYGKS